MTTSRSSLRSCVVLACGVAVSVGVSCKTARADDVTITGRRREVGATTLTRDELRELPGAFGDPGRAIEALPGVIPVGTAVPFSFVRGATPSDTAYFLDGMRVPMFSHGLPGGSVVAGSTIDRVDFFPGAAPARFGGATGGVLSVTTLPPAERARAEVAARLYDSSALVETPLADGRASALASGRYGYTQPILDLLAPSSRQRYWDYHARATWSPSPRSRVSVISLGAHDFVGEGEDRTIVDASFHRVEARYDVALDGGGSLRFAATTGVNIQGNDVGSVTDRILGTRIDVTQSLTSDLRLALGASITQERYDVEVHAKGLVTDPQLLFAPRSDLTNAVHAELAWRVSLGVQIDVGMRAGMFSTLRDAYPRRYGLGTLDPTLPPPAGGVAKVALDPRATVRARLDRRVTFVSAFGIAHGPPSFFLPGLSMSRLEDGLQTAVQSSSGLEVALPGDVSVRATGFLHDYLDLSDPSATCPDHTGILYNPTDPCFGRRVRGRAYGAELLLRRALTRRMAGWLAYTLSRSTRESHARGWVITGASNEALVESASEWDRTHVITALGTYDVGRGWRASARLSFSTGRPYSRTVHGVLVGPYNQDRLPPVHRVDLRVEKKWLLDRERSVSLVLEGFNVTLAREVVQCRPDALVPSGPVPEAYVNGRLPDACRFERSPAFTIPGIGVEGSF